jgi:hypothetical protein
MRKVIPLGHCLRSVHIEFLAVIVGRCQQDVEVM